MEESNKPLEVQLYRILPGYENWYINEYPNSLTRLKDGSIVMELGNEEPYGICVKDFEQHGAVVPSRFLVKI